jgi:hypothetical protein
MNAAELKKAKREVRRSVLAARGAGGGPAPGGRGPVSSRSRRWGARGP